MCRPIPRKGAADDSALAEMQTLLASKNTSINPTCLKRAKEAVFWAVIVLSFPTPGARSKGYHPSTRNHLGSHDNHLCTFALLSFGTVICSSVGRFGEQFSVCSAIRSRASNLEFQRPEAKRIVLPDVALDIPNWLWPVGAVGSIGSTSWEITS